MEVGPVRRDLQPADLGGDQGVFVGLPISPGTLTAVDHSNAGRLRVISAWHDQADAYVRRINENRRAQRGQKP
jgi:hypothetical protein